MTTATGQGRRVLSVAALTAVALALAVDLAVFVFPRAEPTGRTQLVVVLGPPTHGPRLDVARGLANDAPVLVSVNNVKHDCPRVRHLLRGLDVTCLRPHPFTTRGEARAAAAFARSRSLTSVTVVTSQDQLVRAGVRFRRCVQGDVRLAVARVPLRSRLALLPYQNAAMLKALIVERAC